MIEHASIGVRDLAAASAFYEQVLATIGLQKLVVGETTVGFCKSYPEFWLNARPGMAPIAAGGGSHLCLRTRSRSQVDDFYRVALALGARGDGAPGLRPEYSEGYYAAFIRDADGHRIEVVTFLSAAQPSATL
jgi:catechol 2,3-dioxygenase-like lactoylglutathione lyase family enzyme